MQSHTHTRSAHIKHNVIILLDSNKKLSCTWSSTNVRVKATCIVGYDNYLS